jgi:hypothetical protein
LTLILSAATDAALMILSPVPCRRICSADAVHDAENVDPEQCLKVLRSDLEQELDLRALTSSAIFSAPSALTSLMATSALSAASRSAMALPIPLAAPVTTASFLSMLLMGTYLLVGASSGW